MPEELFIAFTVRGVAQPAGSKNSFVPMHRSFKTPFWRGVKSCRTCFGRTSTERCRKCNAQILVNTVDSCKKSGPWKKFVNDTAKLAMIEAGRQVIDSETEGRTGLIPLRLIAHFYQTRPKSHFRTGKFADILRDDAPQFPTDVPDSTKLLRAVEDGLIGAVFKDDCAIVRQTVTKEFGVEDQVKIEIWVIK
jgi:Holliday junction resolvase RusA-like endonuclease